MAFKIKTFANQKPCTFFKALGHPMVAGKLEELNQQKLQAIYDPEGHLEDFLSLTGLEMPTKVYVQKVENAENYPLISSIQTDQPAELFILSFEPEKHLTQINYLLPKSTKVSSLEDLRIPAEMLVDEHNYLSDLNFATNFAFFREQEGWHTRVKGANCWAKYGAKGSKLHAILFDENGQEIIRWEEDVPATVHSIVIDSRDVKKRFNLPDFTGQLFVHITGTKAHSIVKYALDTFHDDGTISATHDANAWPPKYFAGLPAPREGENVILWLQNSHPVTIPADGVTLNIMGEETSVSLDKEIGPFATYALDISRILPEAKWPQQIELQANHYFARPRYEVVNAKGYRCIAHMNVERVDLQADYQVKSHTDVLGKAYILPAPVLPTNKFKTSVLPTPMSRSLISLPVKALVYDKDGNQMAEYFFGDLPRHHAKDFVVSDIVDFGDDYGHVELIYDFGAGDGVDGWLHGLFRYEHKELPAQAETSFGSHIFNTAITYKNEPQSYKGPAPGLTTGLFLRVDDDIDTFCQLIYPSSTTWYDTSDTMLTLFTKDGKEVAQESLKIPRNGSRMWKYQEMFSLEDREKARGGYVIINDNTCRLFGYHGLHRQDGSFSLDHMFGF
jgi:hypothetical protein